MYTVLNGDTFLFCMIGKFGKWYYLPDIADAVAHIHQGGIWSSKDRIQRIRARNDTLRSVMDVVEPQFREELRGYLAKQYLRLAKLALKNIEIKVASQAIYDFFMIRSIR